MKVSAQDVKKLEAMGFSEKESTAALAQHGGNVRAAATQLVSATGPSAGGQPEPQPVPPPTAWTKSQPRKGAIAGSERTPRTRFLEAEARAEAEGAAAAAAAAAATAAAAAAATTTSCFQPDETVERLQIRLEHQQATLAMLRGAGASDGELKVLVGDAAALTRRIGSLQDEQAALAAAMAAAEQAAAANQRGLLAESAARKRRDEAARAEAAAAQQAAAASAVAASAEAAAQKLAAVEAEAEAEAKVVRLAEAERLLAAEVAARERSEAEAAAALRRAAEAEKKVEAVVQAGAASLQSSLQSWVSGRHAVEVLEASPSDPDPTDGTIHTVYHLLLTGPNEPAAAAAAAAAAAGGSGSGGKPTLLKKRYSEFAALKLELEAALPLLGTLDFPEKTWTRWGSTMASTIDDRKARLASWLNHVLFLHSPAENPALAAFCHGAAAAAADPSVAGDGAAAAVLPAAGGNRELAG